MTIMIALEDPVDDDSLGPEEDCIREPSFFTEADKCVEIVHEAVAAENAVDPSVHPIPPAVVAVVKGKYEELKKILMRYQAQPQLLDRHLESLLSPMVDLIRNRYYSRPEASLDAVYSALCTIANVRGPKHIVKFFSHEVSDLEAILGLLNSVHASSPEHWERRYILLMWLSFVVMLPFEISRLDSRGYDKDVTTRILDTCKRFLSQAGKERDAAALALSRVLSRVDVAPKEVPSFVKWVNESVTQSANVFKVTGIAQAICGLLKLTDRALLLPHISSFMKLLQFAETQLFQKHTLLRKFMQKIAQRTGCALMPHRVASWRYDRGARSLQANIQKQDTSGPAPDRTISSISRREVPDIDFEVPEEIEEIIQVLFIGIRDKDMPFNDLDSNGDGATLDALLDTVVRWSAAKGIGRITNRLPKAYAEDIVLAVLDLFEENVARDPKHAEVVDVKGVSDQTWHGACLAVAELARRGLLLPEHLHTAVAWMEHAIKLDLRRGSFSVGSHVRDAACYVCWSFARAYAPDIMQPHVVKLAPSLVCTSLYDREVNVRRAASAAFQESVGRLGIFPDGIAILTTADFFTVGNRTTAFLEAGRTVATFPAYFKPCLDHVLTYPLAHWDPAIRALAAQAVQGLLELRPEVFPETFAFLLPRLGNPDLGLRHGAMLGVTAAMKGAPALVTASNAHAILRVIQGITPNQVDAFGSEFIREGVLSLMEALCRLPFAAADTQSDDSEVALSNQHVNSFLPLINSTLERKESHLQDLAVQVAIAYLDLLLARGRKDQARRIVEEWAQGVLPKRGATTASRQGHARLLGQIPSLFARRCGSNVTDMDLSCVFRALIQASSLASDRQLQDADARRDAVAALGVALVTEKQRGQRRTPESGIDKKGQLWNDEEMERAALHALLDALDDYTTTSHGDVGSHVRMAGLEALRAVAQAFSAFSASVLQPFWQPILSGCFLQALSRIDRVRSLAGTTLQTVVGVIASERDMVGPTFTPATVDLFRTLHTSRVQWENLADALQATYPFLQCEAYHYSIVFGTILCMGNMIGSLSECAEQALLDYLEGASNCGEVGDVALDERGENNNIILEDRVRGVCHVFLRLLSTYPKTDRVVLPVLECLDILYTSQILWLVEDSIHRRLFEAIRTETARSKNVTKVLAAIRVYGGLAGCPCGARQLGMGELIRLLHHPYPRVRKGSAETLVLCTSLFADVCREDAEESGETWNGDTDRFETILTDTDWTTPPKELPNRDDLAKLLLVDWKKVTGVSG